MAEGRPLCPGCFTTDAPQEGEACPTCGFRAETAPDERSPVALPLETVLNGRYRVGRVLGKPGGFGVTYLAFDTRLRQRVAAKEFMPRDVAARATDGESVVLYSDDEEETFQYGLDRFLNEAQMLAQFDHANIVSVRDFFEDNGTAYLVMDYYEGKPLDRYLEEQPRGRMDPEVATEIMLRVLDGLKEVHAEGYLHRDVKPENVYLTKEGRPILIDFGAARLALGERSRSLSVVMTPGYAPYEQYSRKGNQGPHTDVYGAGATLYRMVTGEKPPPATDRVIEDDLEAPRALNVEVPEAVSQAIMGTLRMGDAERTSTAGALQEYLREGIRDKPSKAKGGEEKRKERVEQREASPGRGQGPSSPEAGETAGGKLGGEPNGGDERARTSSQQRERGWPKILIGGLVVAALGLGGVAVALYPSGDGTGGEESGDVVRTNPVKLPSGWQSADGRWWREGIDTSEVFADLDNLTTMGVTEEERRVMQRGRVTQQQFNVAIKQSLIKLYRNGPTIVDLLFEKYAAPKLEWVDLSGDIVGENGKLKSEILNENQKKAYVAITEYYREPQRQQSPDIPWPDSLRAEKYTGIVKLQAHLAVEGKGDNAVARADAIEVLSGTHPTLDRISMKATTQAVWQPAYVRKGGRWTPTDSWVRFSVPFQMR